MQKVNRDEAIFRMFLKRQGLTRYYRIADSGIRGEIRDGVAFSMFRLYITVGVLVRTIREALL